MPDQSPTANREVSPTESRERQRKNARDNLTHAGEFTKIENTAGVKFLAGWINEASRQADEVVQASDDVWALTVLYEHFDSEASSDVKDRTRETRAVLAELKARAERAQARLDQLLGVDDDSKDDSRINELTDKTVQEVLEKLGL
jgi:hypothetical protein